MGLTEPEDRLFAQLGILLGPGDIEHLVYGRFVGLTLRQNEDDLLLQLGVAHPVVQPRKLLNGDTGLARPEERLLAQLNVFLGIDRDVHQPLLIPRPTLLREREKNLLFQILIRDPRVKVAQELGIFCRPPLSEPENRLFA